MNNKISLPELARAMSLSTDFDAKACELFLRELFAVVAETVAAGENVKIKGLGTFKSVIVEERKSVNVNTGEQMLIPSHRKVTFTPDKALAEAVNAPFSMFEPVELNDNITEEMLEGYADANSENQSEPEPPHVADTRVDTEKDTETQSEVKLETIAETEAIVEPAPLPEPAAEPEPQSNSEPENRQEAEPETVPKDDEPAAINEHIEQIAVQQPAIEDDERVVSHFGKGFLIGALCAVVLLATLLLAWRIIFPNSFNAVTKSMTVSLTEQYDDGDAVPAALAEDQSAAQKFKDAQQTDTAASIKPDATPDTLNVPTLPSDQKAAPSAEKTDKESAKPAFHKDKITKRRYLTTMAREYYGDYNLWPLIYDYNKGLGHPDRIRPGTKIKVPTPETLGINPSDPAVIKKAKVRGREIYKKYR